MIYIGNGIYSTSGSSDYLMHYGVLGMKWGVRKARMHEKNLYRYNRSNGMSRQEAKDLYKKRMADVNGFAKKNLGTSMRARDIQNKSRDAASKKISNYDKKVRNQKIRKGVTAALAAAALAGTAYAGYKHYKKAGTDKNIKMWKNASERENRYAKENAKDAINLRDKGFTNMASESQRWAATHLNNSREYSRNAASFKPQSDAYAKSRNRAGAIGGAIGLAAAGYGAYSAYKKRNETKK